jgi:PadR family transcriptional regulator, regulatory protein PadR
MTPFGMTTFAIPRIILHLTQPIVLPGKLLTGNYTVRYTVYVTYYMSNGSQATTEVFENLKLELRRGCLTLAVLTQLRSERYGYTLRKALADDGLEIDEGTLYPLLRRLESQGLLVSQWREEDKRNKRFYRLSPVGEQILEQLLGEWQRINTSLSKILQEA